MLSAISSADPAHSVKQTSSSAQQKPQAKSQTSTANSTSDTVQLSSAAQAILAAVKEARETPADTAKEAAGGDPQARRLLAKEGAASPSNSK